MNKYVRILPAVSAVVASGILLKPAFVQAQSTSSDQIQSLVQRIAQKFNLNQNDVQAVFDQYKVDEQSQRETNYETRLSQLVSQGKITEAQKTLLINKHKELEVSRQSQLQSWKNLTPEQRKQQRDQQQQTLQSWAKQNNVDLQYLRWGEGHGRGMRSTK